jgi:NADH:ubiquinone oxidoreductase subunit
MTATSFGTVIDWLNSTYIRVFTARKGEKVGTDRYGNTYYKERSPRGKRERRWVIYAGDPEASRVPPEWHGWLHHTRAEPLPPDSPYHKPWVKEHRENATGTLQAYRPPGHLLEGGRRAKATGDYEAWTPD